MKLKTTVFDYPAAIDREVSRLAQNWVNDWRNFPGNDYAVVFRKPMEHQRIGDLAVCRKQAVNGYLQDGYKQVELEIRPDWTAENFKHHVRRALQSLPILNLLND